jgi:hypothetical protein
MLLFHGTSKVRFDKILAENRLGTASCGDPAVCMTYELSPAEYWANLSAEVDTSVPIVIHLDVSALLKNGYVLTPYSDPVWGEGKCDWECEVRTYQDIYPLSEIMHEYRCLPSTEAWQPPVAWRKV